ncbi:helix-turn-helix transcriptional regulator [Chitinophaga sp. sic0106]|uniref:helix-turn-helix transcriptional regulator n=1 Tax=Chitinophaga sp. sic0106 TaxID=2854785 RepID=UPI001C451F9C|nr:helix-turn-helix transcriptional regulator [Chitinophaga sp. sic0106]MBV7528866.1 helix-turn-helix domain-containing protein [Chitinophaga sp. sic0106]
MQTSLIHMGHRLKQILKQRKIKVIDFAKKAGFTNQIAHYHLRKSDMKRANLERFCTIIGITTEEFMRWNGAQLIAQDKNLHHGERLVAIIAEKGLNRSRLAERMDMSRRTMYNLFEKQTFSPSELERAAKAVDISLEAFLNPGTVDEARNSDTEEMMTQREKYYKLLEDHNELLHLYNNLKDEVIQLRRELQEVKKVAKTR